MATTTLEKNLFDEFESKHKAARVAYASTDFKKLVGIGSKSGSLCNKMLSHNYISVTHDDFASTLEWLQTRVKENRSLPDAILYDVDLEGDIPFENVALLKKLEEISNVPVILITSVSNPDEKQAALRAGADDYYDANVSTDDLNFRILFLKKLNGILASSDHNQGRKGSSRLEIWGLKRAFDLFVAIPLFLVLSPLFLLIAILIKFDSKGPIFYISKRAGKGYKVFNFYKFRTMKIGADKELEQLKHKNQYASEGDSLFFKIEKDPRITKIGRFLRNTSLDELPQIVNVIKGDMSLVGNRPLPLYEAMQLTKDQWAMRFNAPAGITGLWQVTKRGKKNMSEEERIRLDISYARRNSFLFDIKILFKTLPAAIQKENV